MKTGKISLVYFSPTGSTKRILQSIGKNAGIAAAEFDYTDYNSREMKLRFTEKDTVVFGIPVYSGRVPETAAMRLQNVTGKDTPAILVVTYGNREYDDALIELRDIVEQRGFKAVAAAAFVTEHSIVRSIAKGRPDSNDFNAIADFTSRFLKKLESIKSISKTGELTVKGNSPYREIKPIPFKPRANSRCKNCGACVKLCPVHAIPEDDPKLTDRDRCISCMRCVRMCPDHSRKLRKIELWLAKRILSKQCRTEKQPEIFI